MEIIYRIVGLSVLMAFLYAMGSIYHEVVKSEEQDRDIGMIIIRTLINMVKIIVVFSVVCTAIIYLFLKPVIMLLS